MSFSSQESVFLQTLHHYSVSLDNSSVIFHLYFICFGQKEPIKVQIFRLSTAHMKINKFLMSFFKPRVSFPLNFASPFGAITDNSSEIFYLKHYMLWTKRARHYTVFQTFKCSNESSPNSWCHFWNHKFRVHSNFASLFSSNLIYFG